MGGIPSDDQTTPVAANLEDEAAARQRRLDARRRKKDSQWNFSGRSAADRVDDRIREHEAELDRRRRLAFKLREGKDETDDAGQHSSVRVARREVVTSRQHV